MLVASLGLIAWKTRYGVARRRPQRSGKGPPVCTAETGGRVRGQGVCSSRENRLWRGARYPSIQVVSLDASANYSMVTFKVAISTLISVFVDKMRGTRCEALDLTLVCLKVGREAGRSFGKNKNTLGKKASTVRPGPRIHRNDFPTRIKW